MKVVTRCLDFLDDYEYVLLVASLLLTLVLYPYFLNTSNPSLWLHISITVVLLIGLYSASTHERFLRSSLILGVLTLCLWRINYLFHDMHMLAGAYLITGLGFFVFISYNLILTLHQEKRINSQLIFGAVAGYLLIGLLSTFVYTLIELLQPGSFQIAHDSMGGFPDFIYYSYVTLTTLGFGDMVPISYIAQSWSVIFALLGQMYLSILIGVIVGKYIHTVRAN